MLLGFSDMSAGSYLQFADPSFTRRVRKGPDHWIWIGKVGPHGYGIGRYNRPAHTWSYRLHTGRVPYGYQVVQTCDGGRLCVNPAHLALRKGR